MATSEEQAEEDLLKYALSFAKDPLGFVENFFPWGEEGTDLENETGPEPWQRECLIQIGLGVSPDHALQVAVAAGHGVGKSALVAWLILWGMSTFPDTRVIITANTEGQLTSKTWPEVQKWHRMCLTKHWFKWTATQLLSADQEHEKSWNAIIMPWSEAKPESFQGLHNKGKRALVIFDEASAIPDVIFEAIEGAFTDAKTERIWAIFGNPTRNTGRFRESWDKFKKYWKTFIVDSRDVKHTDKEKIAQWEDTYGEDSDFFRVRVRGLFPRSGSNQLIPGELVDAAMKREAASDLTDPVIIGVDVARFGKDSSVIFIRKGYDGRSFPAHRYSGITTMELASRVVETALHYQADAVFIDETGMGVGVLDRVTELLLYTGCMVNGVNFSSSPEGMHFDAVPVKYANKRAEIWGRMKVWLRHAALPSDPILKDELIGTEYFYNKKNEIQLTPKDDLDVSPDYADAIAVTFSQPISMGRGLTDAGNHGNGEGVDFDPYAYQQKDEAA